MINEIDCAKRLKEAEIAYEADDMEFAISAFKVLAEENVAEACQYLGLIYRTGDGVDKDDSIARRWYSKYVFLLKSRGRSGCKSATYALAKLYQYGEHVCKDEAKALKLITNLAEEGFAEAQYTLATFFRNGWCQCDVNESKYEFWLEKSAEGGHPEAMYYYGLKLVGSGYAEPGKKFLVKSAECDFWMAKDYLSGVHGR